MPWIMCSLCQGTSKVTEEGLDSAIREPDVNVGDDCPWCKGSSRPGHIYREFLA